MENSCGLTVMQQAESTDVATSSSPRPRDETRRRASAPTPEHDERAHNDAHFKATSPTPPAALYAAAISASASHSWLTHGLSLVKEYGIVSRNGMGSQDVLAETDVPPQVRVGGRSRSDERKHNEHQCGEEQVRQVSGLHREVIVYRCGAK